MKEWVVDTWVLATCHSVDCDDCLDCLKFLTNLESKGKLCLDHEGEIYKEYKPYIRPRTPVFWWWKRMTEQAGHFSFWSNSLTARHEMGLMGNLKFDNDDIKFVGVASRSKDKIIVSGDSGYNANVCGYLQRMLRIEVMHPSYASSNL